MPFPGISIKVKAWKIYFHFLKVINFLRVLFFLRKTHSAVKGLKIIPLRRTKHAKSRNIQPATQVLSWIEGDDTKASYKPIKAVHFGE